MLLDHVVTRILESISLNNTDCDDFTLFCKYGSDGSSGHAMYKQVFESIGKSDIYVTVLVPLELICSNTGKIVWANDRHSSFLFTRPVRLQIIREDANVILAEYSYMQEKISLLQNFYQDNQTFKYRLLFTMIDGKVYYIFYKSYKKIYGQGKNTYESFRAKV